MPNDPVQDVLNSAKSTLAKANQFTQSVEGTPTSTFASKAPEPPKIPQAPQSRKPSYSLASQARALGSGFGNVAQGLKNRQQNVQQYADTNKQ